jgi:hypothetical protein
MPTPSPNVVGDALPLEQGPCSNPDVEEETQMTYKECKRLCKELAEKLGFIGEWGEI